MHSNKLFLVTVVLYIEKEPVHTLMTGSFIHIFIAKNYYSFRVLRFVAVRFPFTIFASFLRHILNIEQSGLETRAE